MVNGKRKKKTLESTRSGFDVTTKTTTTYSKPKKSGVKSSSRIKKSTIGSKIKPVKAKTNYKSTRSRKGRVTK